VEEQKKEEAKPIEVEGVEEWKVEKILNKRKIRGVEKYLVCWKGFTVEYNTWEREEDLGNAREAVEEFEKRMSTEVRRQEKLDIIEVSGTVHTKVEVCKIDSEMSRLVE